MSSDSADSERENGPQKCTIPASRCHPHKVRRPGFSPFLCFSACTGAGRSGANKALLELLAGLAVAKSCSISPSASAIAADAEVVK